MRHKYQPGIEGTMEDILIYNLSDAGIDLENVLQLLDCRQGSAVYGQVLEEFEEVKTIFYTLVKPETRLLFDEIPDALADTDLPAGTKVIYLIHTIGADVSAYCTQAFTEGDYLKGMLMDAISSSFLFGMDHLMPDIIKTQCAKRMQGVLCRLEAPRDISMLAQKVACEKLFGAGSSVVSTSSAFMLDPPKSNCVIYRLTDDPRILHTQQDCSKCTEETCPMRRQAVVDVKIIQKTGTHIIPCDTDENLLEALRRQKLYASAACGGTGKCGKCKIQFLEGATEPTHADRTHFTQKELDRGIRLACQAYPLNNCTIRMDLPDESDFEILAETSFSNLDATDSEDEEYAVAMDIGTTTIAAALVGLTTKRAKSYYTTLNRQRMFGADVISRMQASSDGKKDQLQKLVSEDILLCVQKLVEENKVEPGRIRKMVLAGNTTMGHLLRGYPCQTLGVFPFTPFLIEKEEIPFDQMLDSKYLNCPVVLYPGISTFVGGDIVSGLLSCGYESESEINLFIDLGTNGEMGIGNKDRILVTSTAAGPAFEGGNISWGTGSVQGAISSILIDGQDIKIETIGSRSPVGICGTGIIEVVSELLKNDIIDDTGLLEDPYFENGFEVAKTPSGEPILVTQRDIREIQLAKSAVRSGIEVLLKRYGAEYADVDTVFLAGGFGVKIDQEKAIRIGMLPEELRGKIRAVGNSSLSGAIEYCVGGDASGRIEKIIEKSSEISLSSDKDFNDLYVDHMFFSAVTPDGEE